MRHSTGAQRTHAMKTVRIATAQTPEFRDDVFAALSHLNDVSAGAQAQDVALIVFPEGYLQGYILKEQDARPAAIDLSSPTFETLLSRFPRSGPMIVVGLIEIDDRKLFNTAIVVRCGELIGRYRKVHLLAAEGAFSPGHESPIFEIEGLRFGINICYDTNFPDAAQKVVEAGGSLIVCCANNMMPRNKAESFREVHNAVRADRCRETGLWLVSSDITGERDGMVCWGPSAVLSPTGEVVAQLPLGQPGLLTFDLPVLSFPDCEAGQTCRREHFTT
jgi:predicted amidohydrolase